MLINQRVINNQKNSAYPIISFLVPFAGITPGRFNGFAANNSQWKSENAAISATCTPTRYGNYKGLIQKGQY